MLNVHDYELRKEPETPGFVSAPKPWGLWIAAALLIAGLAVAGYVLFGRRASSPASTANVPVSTTQEIAPTQPLGGEPAAIDLPPLAETDALVRELVRGISSHPGVGAWLATDGLIRNFTVVVANVADQRTPARHLPALRPSGAFQVMERGSELYIDPRSYDRYNALASAVESLDPAGSARLYATLKPRIDEAYRELGVPDTPFDRTLERAIVSLLNTPVPPDQVRLEPRGIVFAFADPKLEGLTSAQKQLLRTGPRNVRRVKAALHDLALALGIPAERLPAR